MSRTTFVAVSLAAVLTAGCVCCDTATPYEQAPRGGDAVLTDLEVPGCLVLNCMVKIDVVNSHRRVVRVIYEGNPDVVEPPTPPVTWDTRDDDGQPVPEDTYVVRAWRDNERTDAVVVFVFE